MTTRPRIIFIGKQAIICGLIALAFMFMAGWITQAVLWGMP